MPRVANRINTLLSIREAECKILLDVEEFNIEILNIISFFFFCFFFRRNSAGVPKSVARSVERQIRRLDIVEGNTVKRQDQCRGYTRFRS